MEQSVAAPSARRARRSDVHDFDEELGLIAEWRGSPEAVPDAATRARWVGIATDLVPLVGELSGYRRVMPIGTPPASEIQAAASTVSAELLRALPELEALHRKLLPGWRAIVEQWFMSGALAKIEDAQRALRKPAENVKGVGYTLTNTAPPRHVVSAAELLAQLRREPPELFDQLRRSPPKLLGEIPAGLTVEMLVRAAEKVARKAGGKGLTPAKATEFVELLAFDAERAKSLAERRTAAAKKRTLRRKKAPKKRAKRRKN